MRLADEAHDAVGQRWAGEVGVDDGERVVGRDAEVGGGEHGDDAGRRQRVVDVDRAERGVGDLGAGEDGVQLARQVEVVQVARRAGEQFGILRAQHPSPQDRTSHRRNLPTAQSPNGVAATEATASGGPSSRTSAASLRP